MAPIICTQGTYYWAGTSFATATQIYSDSNLTTVANDGWYSVGGVYRQMVGGVLGPQTLCPSCVIPCGTGLSIGGFSTGLFAIAFDMGTAPGAAVITFSAGVSNTTLRPIPDGLTWNYNGMSGSEGSALVGGYQRGITGAPDGPPATFSVPCFNTNPGSPPITTATGSNGIQPNGAQYYVWDASINNFVASGAASMGPYTGITNNVSGSSGVYPNIESLESTCLDWNCTNINTNDCGGGGTALDIPPSPFDPAQAIAPNLQNPVGNPWDYSNGEYRGWTTVIPSPLGVTNSIATIMITAPCINTWWGIHVQCPRQLTSIGRSVFFPLGTPWSNVCAADIQETLYHVPVDNAGNTNPNSKYFANDQFPVNYDPATPGQFGQPDGVLGLHDWVFEDPDGVTPLPIGMYLVEFDPQDGTGLGKYVIEVGFLEYRDVDGAGHALPPEGYPGPTQSTGTRQPGIVRSITKCP